MPRKTKGQKAEEKTLDCGKLVVPGTVTGRIPTGPIYQDLPKPQTEVGPVGAFQVGDEVEVVNNKPTPGLYFSGFAAEVGARARVVRVPSVSGPQFVDLEWVRDGRDKRQNNGGYYPQNFKKVEVSRAQLVAATSPFQVGDTVEYLGRGYLSARQGATAIVTSVPSTKGDQWVDVRWVKDDLANGQMDGAYAPGYFKLAHSEPKPETPVTFEADLVGYGQTADGQFKLSDQQVERIVDSLKLAYSLSSDIKVKMCLMAIGMAIEASGKVYLGPSEDFHPEESDNEEQGRKNFDLVLKTALAGVVGG